MISTFYSIINSLKETALEAVIN